MDKNIIIALMLLMLSCCIASAAGDSVGVDSIGDTNVTGNATTAIGSSYLAVSSKDAAWGATGGEFYTPVSAIIVVVVLVIAASYAIKVLRGMGRNE